MRDTDLPDRYVLHGCRLEGVRKGPPPGAWRRARRIRYRDAVAERRTNKRGKKGAPEQGAVGKLFDTAGVPIHAVQTARERLNGFLLPWARRVGWLGMSALVVCAALALIDPDHWPAGVDEDELPKWAVGSLVAASLVGWGCMQVGMRPVRRALGERFGRPLLVLLPVLCGLAVLAHVRGWTDVSAWPGGAWLHPFVRFYTPCLVVIGLVSYVGRRVTTDDEDDEADLPRRFERGLWLLVVLAPYALLVVHLAFGADLEWLHDPLEDALEGWGTAALVLQVVLAYFVTSSVAG